MKGIIFTTFLEMVESKFSLRTADQIIRTADLPSGGSYTSVGTYDHQEMIALVVKLSEQTGIPASELVFTFGEYMFGQLNDMHPQFIAENDSVFAFLLNVDSYIHREVRKLYPDAELPSFSYDTSTEGTLVMTYRSARPFADLAEGLIVGCIAHFGENIRLVREDAPGENATRFILTRQEETRHDGA